MRMFLVMKWTQVFELGTKARRPFKSTNKAFHSLAQPTFDTLSIVRSPDTKRRGLVTGLLVDT